MDNKHTPAFPLVAGNQSNPDDRILCEGLSKREYIATIAMQGMLANDWQGYAKRCEECDALARAAVNFADALLKELEP